MATLEDLGILVNSDLSRDELVLASNTLANVPPMDAIVATSAPPAQPK